MCLDYIKLFYAFKNCIIFVRIRSYSYFCLVSFLINLSFFVLIKFLKAVFSFLFILFIWRNLRTFVCVFHGLFLYSFYILSRIFQPSASNDLYYFVCNKIGFEFKLWVYFIDSRFNFREINFILHSLLKNLWKRQMYYLFFSNFHLGVNFGPNEFPCRSKLCS